MCYLLTYLKIQVKFIFINFSKLQKAFPPLRFKLHVLHARSKYTTREVETVLSFVVLRSSCLHCLISVVSPCSVVKKFHESGIPLCSSTSYGWLFVEFLITSRRIFWYDNLHSPRRLTFGDLLYQSWYIVHVGCNFFFFST